MYKLKVVCLNVLVKNFVNVIKFIVFIDYIYFFFLLSGKVNVFVFLGC